MISSVGFGGDGFQDALAGKGCVGGSGAGCVSGGLLADDNEATIDRGWLLLVVVVVVVVAVVLTRPFSVVDLTATSRILTPFGLVP